MRFSSPNIEVQHIEAERGRRGTPQDPAKDLNFTHALQICAALAMMTLGFAISGIADLFASSGRPSSPCDLFSA